MLKYFKTLGSAKRYAGSNCKNEILFLLIDKEAKEYGDDFYVVASEAGINHLDQMNWDYRVIETWE